MRQWESSEERYENKTAMYDKFINERLIAFIPPGSQVLDVGCSTGRFGEKLIRDKKCRVYGVDISARAIEQAKERLKAAVRTDIEREELPFENQVFDVIVMADVLEHLVHPQAVLDIARKRLKPEGFMLVSIPNVANIRIRLRLLFGQWRYTESGILDSTHLHFYTRKTAKEFFEQLGFAVAEIAATPGFDFVIGKWRLFRGITDRMCQLHPRLFANQFIFVLRPHTAH